MATRLAGLSPLVEEFVRGARVARLATVDARARPHMVPICFVLEGGSLYSPLDEKPKSGPPERLQRVRNIRARPDVQVLVDEYAEDWSRLAFVQLRGAADILDPGAEHSAALAALRAKYDQYRMMALESRPMVRIRVVQVVAWGRRFESNQSSR